MSGNTFGKVFRLTTFGESHGIGLGGVLDGCPPGIELSVEDIQAELNKRRPGAHLVVLPGKKKTGWKSYLVYLKDIQQEPP